MSYLFNFFIFKNVKLDLFLVVLILKLIVSVVLICKLLWINASAE